MGDHQLVISDPPTRKRQYRLVSWIIGNLVVLGVFGHDLVPSTMDWSQAGPPIGGGISSTCGPRGIWC
jgi:hypothetical protein